MKFTSEDLMKVMGLSVGDRIKTCFIEWEEFEVIYDEEDETVYIRNESRRLFIKSLVGIDFEILPRPKRVGDTLCKDYECVECHLRCLPYCNQFDNGKKTLFNTLNSWNEYDTFDQEIHDLLKARLDKVVE